jgi:hypothetical protein
MLIEVELSAIILPPPENPVEVTVERFENAVPSGMGRGGAAMGCCGETASGR